MPERSSPPKPLLAVSGSQRPYIFDMPHLLSLPIGFEFRFRYRHRWVDEGLLTAMNANAPSFVGRDIVLLFHSQDSKRIIPIRRGTVLGLESIGPMVFLRFRAGEFAKTDLNIETFSRPKAGVEIPAADRLAALAQELLGKIPGGETFDLSCPLPSGWYLREAHRTPAYDTWDRHDHTAAWTKLAAILQNEPTLASIPLFYLLGFQTEAGAGVTPSAIRNRFSRTREKIYGFPLVESERYRMRVVEWCEPPKEIDTPPARVHCEFNDAHLALEGASNLVVGRYDVIEFTFSALQTGYSEIALRAEPLEKKPPVTDVIDSVEIQSGKAATSWSEWPAIFVARVPVVVRPKARRLLLPAISLVLGLVLYLGVAPETANARWKGVVELVSLGFLFFAYGSVVGHLERLFKLSAGMKKLSAGPETWATGEKS